MKRLLMVGVVFLSITITGYANESITIPWNEIKDEEVTVLKASDPKNLNGMNDFYNKVGWDWNSYDKNHLDSLIIEAKARYSLEKYPAGNAIDKNLNTAWAFNHTQKNWLEINIEAELDIETTTPFTITAVGIVPGYSKNEKVWQENNRIRKAKLIIYSKQPEKNYWSDFEYTVFELNFPDKVGHYFFIIPDDKQIPNEPMIKKVWLIVEDVYKGTKYNDTCISEIVFDGRYSN